MAESEINEIKLITKENLDAYDEELKKTLATMTGNSAEYRFSEDLITTFAIGNFSLSGGQATIPAKNKTLKEVWDLIYLQEVNTELKTNPSVSFLSGNVHQYIEIGSSTTQTVSLSFKDGEYKYGYTSATTGNDGDEVDKATITNDKTTGVNLSSYTLTYNSSSLSSTSGTFSNIESGIETTRIAKSISASASYSDGNIPVSNLYKMYPSEKITAGTTGEITFELFRWYVPMYHGFKYKDDLTPISDFNILSDSKAKPEDVTSFITSFVNSLEKITDEDAYNENVPVGGTVTKDWRQYFVLVPDSYNKEKADCIDSAGLPMNVYKGNDIPITYGSGTNAVTITYNLFYISQDADHVNHGITLTWYNKEEE